MNRIEYYIPVERALELYNTIVPSKRVLTEEELNDALGNGRCSSIVDTDLLNEDELRGLEGANFLRYHNNWRYPCLLIVDKETYPGKYFLSEC